MAAHNSAALAGCPHPRRRPRQTIGRQAGAHRQRKKPAAEAAGKSGGLTEGEVGHRPVASNQASTRSATGTSGENLMLQ
jgi:hypothetical protein